MKNFFKNKNNLYIVVGVLIVCAIGSTIVTYNLFFKGVDNSQKLATNQLQPTPIPSLFTPTSSATASPTRTPVPTPSREWRVVENSDQVKIGKYYYAIVTFENLTTGEKKKGQCQQPAWRKPEIGHLYILANTYADYWLFIPVEGVEDQTLQRFAPFP